MILADKIIDERKKCGFSQEELAEKLNVSRQAISKWEGAQSVPDLSRIIEMSKIFGVSTDYLLMDDLDNEARLTAAGSPAVPSSDSSALRIVSMEEASEFLQLRQQAAGKIALATLLCILSPIALLLFGGMSEFGAGFMSENKAVAFGMVLMLILVAAAVAIYITVGQRNHDYEYLETESFETAYGVSGMVKETKRVYREKYSKYNVLGTMFCIFSVLPLFLSIAVDETNEKLMITAVCLMFLFAGVGVFLFIYAGVHFASVEKLLQEGDYTRRKKSPLYRAISTAYWLIAVAIYLLWSFTTEQWEITWLVWPVASVVFPALLALAEALGSKE